MATARQSAKLVIVARPGRISSNTNRPSAPPVSFGTIKATTRKASAMASVEIAKNRPRSRPVM